MSNHAPAGLERHCDTVVVGGSPVGLAAAAELGRRRRSVIVVDPGGATGGREEVRAHGGEVLDGRVVGLARRDDGRFGAELAGGHLVVARTVLVAAGLLDEATCEALASLGIHPAGRPSGSGSFIETDSSGATAAPGVYVAEPAGPGADGAGRGPGIGAAISRVLATDDHRVPGRAPANQIDWDRRYGGEPLWSGNPNGTLVHEVSGLRPGRALDVGAGEGGDALWLAEQGWTVTASDISRRALERIETEAGRRGLAVECRHDDANGPGGYGAAAFDLVSAHYASIPRTPDGRAVRNLLDAVAPGGTLLVVGHDLEPMRRPVDTRTESRPFDPDAYVRVDDFAAALTGSADWEIEVHAKRARPPGAASSHHVDDVVLRARRRAG